MLNCVEIECFQIVYVICPHLAKGKQSMLLLCQAVSMTDIGMRYNM